MDGSADGKLWVIDTSAHVVRKIKRSGESLKIQIADCQRPSALCRGANGRLLVADDALARKQIRVYRASDGMHIPGADFGSAVYMGENPGTIAPGKFYHITSIRADAEDNLYVGCWDYGGKIYKFNASRQQVWVLKGLEFVSCADADPGDDTSIYSPGHRYLIDYAKEPGKSWREVAITIDPLRYPEDPRLRVDAWMAMRMFRLQGQKIMQGKTQMQPNLFFWRFDGEIAVPAAMYFPGGADRNLSPAQNFSARWTGFIEARVTGRHVFTAVSDEGVRVWVNGNLIIEHWTPHAAEEKTGEVVLEAGRRYALKVEYFQKSGPCCLRLFWQVPGRQKEIVPSEALFTAASGDGNGLKAQFFRGINLDDPEVNDSDLEKKPEIVEITGDQEEPVKAERNLAQRRIDPAIDYPIFVGAIDQENFGVPPPEWPPEHPKGPFIWSDANGDGAMQAAEYQTAPRGSQALMMDINGDIWTNTGGWEAGKGQITRIPFAGINSCGAPTWDIPKATSKIIPSNTDIQYLSKLSYDPVNDRMYLGVWTKKHPFPGGGWEQMSVGPVVQCFSNWSQSPALVWEQVVIPPEGIFGKVPKAW
ncbi:MAG: PA14 domain-containing protein, partial [Planctomycetota bacterium]|nr:PA14 domain-containing protein [Planctomycetota bacterium]